MPNCNARRQKAIPRGVSNSLAVYAERASNAEIWDVEGKRYVDFASGIAVLNTGHLHPKVQAAIAQQLEKFTHTCFQVTPYESYVALAEQLNELAPGTTPKKTIFLSTGAEAVENAIKIARYHTKRSAVIAFSRRLSRPHARVHQPHRQGAALQGGLRTDAAGGVPRCPSRCPTTASAWRTPRGARAAVQGGRRSGARRGDHHRAGAGRRRLLHRAARNSCARCARLCDRHGIVLIVDEIQSGFGRTGTHVRDRARRRRARPDDDRQEHRRRRAALGRHRQGRDHGRTAARAASAAPTPARRSGAPPALAVLEVMREEQLLKRAQEIGRFMSSRLKGLQVHFPAIGEVRALGAMVAMELVKNSARRCARRRAHQGAGAGGRPSRAGAALLRRVRQRDPLPRRR